MKDKADNVIEYIKQSEALPDIKTIWQIHGEDDIRAEEREKALKEFVTTLKERFVRTETMATNIHGRRDSELASIVDAVAAEYGVEVEK